MKLIKLNAIDSTNSFLKELAQNSILEQFTVVVTNNQTSGRGQINNSWKSEPYKNLTFSVFTPLKNVQIKHQAFLNFAVSLAIYDALTSLSIPNLSIKWPNDILSDNLKICGILIETTFLKQRIKNTIVGIGLNVNQEKFSKKLSKASSLKMIMKKNFDLEILMNDIIKRIKFRFSSIEIGNLKKIYEDYHEALYKKGTPITFFHKEKEFYFMGIITGVSYLGNLQIQLEDNTILECGIKEISFTKV